MIAFYVIITNVIFFPGVFRLSLVSADLIMVAMKKKKKREKKSKAPNNLFLHG